MQIMIYIVSKARPASDKLIKSPDQIAIHSCKSWYTVLKARPALDNLVKSPDLLPVCPVLEFEPLQLRTFTCDFVFVYCVNLELCKLIILIGK